MGSPIQPAFEPSAHRLDQAGWRKSSYSGTQGNCVELAVNAPAAVAVRDSKNPAGPQLTFTAAGWRTFVMSLQNGKA
jgi:hypothetical protein